MLTTNTIARWLGKAVQEDVFSLSATGIKQVLEYTEVTDCYRFLARSATVAEAIALFETYESYGRLLSAILFTQNGLEQEALLGIMTVSDLPKAHKAIVL